MIMKKSCGKRWLSLLLVLLLVIGNFSGLSVKAADEIPAIKSVTVSTDTVSASGGEVTVTVAGTALPGTLYYRLQEKAEEDIHWSALTMNRIAVNGIGKTGGVFKAVIPANNTGKARQVRVGVNDTNSNSGMVYHPTVIFQSAAGNESEEVDKTELDKAIKAAEALNASDYTAESWSSLTTALSVAKTVFSKADALKADVDASTAVLNNAIAALVKNTPEIAENSKIQAKVSDKYGNAVSGVKFELVDTSASDEHIADITSDVEGNLDYSVENLQNGTYRLKMPFTGEYTCSPSKGYLYQVADGKIAQIDSKDFTGTENIQFTLTKIGGTTEPDTPQTNAKTLLINVVDKDGKPFDKCGFAIKDLAFPDAAGVTKYPSNGILKVTVDAYCENGEVQIASASSGKYTIEPEKISFTAKNGAFTTVNGQAYDGTQTFTIKVTENGGAEVEKPEIKTITADPTNLSSDGGMVTFTVAGTKLMSNLNVSVTGVTESAQVQLLKKIDTDMLQQYTVHFPANDSKEAKEYMIVAAIKGDLLSTQNATVTVSGKEETDNPGEITGNAKITSAKVTPEQVDNYGGTVKLEVTGTELTDNNWGVEAKAYLAGMDVAMDQFKIEVTDITATGATLKIPENTMKNALEYRIVAGARTKDGIAEQAIVKVLQDAKGDSVKIYPELVEMVDDYTINITMEQNVTLGMDGDAAALRKRFFIADYGNENSNRIELTDEDEITVENNIVSITFKESPELKTTSQLYVKNGALRSTEGVNVSAFSWLITSKPRVTAIVLEKDILDSKGGTVKGYLKGVRLNEINDIEGKILMAGSSVAMDIPVTIGSGERPEITFDLPENTSKLTKSYSISLTLGGIPVYVSSVVSVLPDGATDKDQTLSALTITGNNKTYTNEDSTEIVVKVSQQEGELKTRLNLYGTNLDSTKTEVRAIDQNGVIWPVHHIPE